MVQMTFCRFESSLALCLTYINLLSQYLDMIYAILLIHFSYFIDCTLGYASKNETIV